MEWFSSVNSNAFEILFIYLFIFVKRGSNSRTFISLRHVIKRIIFHLQKKIQTRERKKEKKFLPTSLVI